MKLTLLPLEDGDVLRIRCEGMVSLRSSSNSQDPLAELLGPRCFSRTIVLDLSDAQSVDTSGVVWLVGVSEKFAQSQGRLIIHSVSPVIRRMLDVMRLAPALCMVADEAEALRSLQESRPGLHLSSALPEKEPFSPARAAGLGQAPHAS